MARALLVTALDVPQAGVVERVVRGQVRAPRDAEYMVNALGLEAFHDGVDGSHDGAGPFGGEIRLAGQPAGKVSLTSGFSRSERISCGAGPLREVQIGAAAHADLVGDRDHVSALRALSQRVVLLVAVEERREDADSRQRQAPTRNQIRNELPFMRPITPVATPNTKAMTMKVTCSEHAQGPDHRHDGDHGNHDPGDRRDEARARA